MSNTLIPYEQYDTAPKMFYNMGPPAGDDACAGTLNDIYDSNHNLVKQNPDVIFFNDGQNYRVVMNYYYTRFAKETFGPGGKDIVFVPVYPPDVVRGYESRQTTTRPFANGNFNSNWVVNASGLINGYPDTFYNNPIDPHYHQMINGTPGYWTATNDVSCGKWYGHWVAYGIYHMWVNDPAVKLGIDGTSSPKGGSVYQDVYATPSKFPWIGGPWVSLSPNTQYTLSFYAMGSGSGTRARIDWKNSVGHTLRTDVQPIATPSWQYFTLTATSPSDTYYATITFEAVPSGYAYISSSAFG